MTSARQRVSVVASALLVAALAAQALLVRGLDRMRTGASMQEMLYISSPRVLRGLSLGFTGLMGDVYWTRVVQYYGGKRTERARDFSLLYPLLDITTDLDPQLIVAYEAGSVFLSQQQPVGAGRPDLAVALIRKGIQANPSRWHLFFTLGFIDYMDRHDPSAAAQDFLEGAKLPGAKSWMKTMGAAMLNKAGEAGTARALWTEMYNSSGNKEVRATALMHLQSLEVDDVVPKIEARIDQYRRSFGHLPASWTEMVRAGYLRDIPRDPNGKPFKLTSRGTVELENPYDFPFSQQGLPPGFQRPKF